jgi:diguanylate cyclase (GGDEF)-like protein
MQKLPVTRDGKADSEIILIDSNTVLKIENIRDRQYIVYTKEEKYFLHFSFDSIEEWLFEDGFRMIDSLNIVNMHHVTEYDVHKGIVYLGDNKHNPKTITASAARIHKEHIENVMKMLQIANRDKAKGENNEHLYEELLQYLSEQENNELFFKSYATILAVNERKLAEQKIMHMAYHDLLTNLPNRLLFHERLKQALIESFDKELKAAVIFLDLDRFKMINDTLGHYVGDKLLKFVAEKLESYAREGDTLARFGGDEFIFLLTNISHVDEIIQFSKGIPDLFSEPFVYENHEFFISCSLGISIYPADGEDADTLIKNADTAMYRAKDKGGSTFQLYLSDMNSRYMERLNLENRLRRAIEKDEIVIYYQPLLDLRTGKILGTEALIRWIHPEWGMISPAEFIPLAEETRLIVQIGNWTMKQACAQNKKWIDLGFGSLHISVNISLNQIQQPGFVRIVENILEETGLDPDLLYLEITENVAMKNVNYVMNTMQQLEKLGVHISIDDFGTGYSSLSYLKRFPVHTLKIDKSFIKDVISSSEDSAAIVTALIAMSQRLNIVTLAEGVETIEQLEFLREQGCDQIQGFVFSKPVPPEQFEQMIKENRSLYVI